MTPRNIHIRDKKRIKSYFPVLRLTKFVLLHPTTRRDEFSITRILKKAQHAHAKLATIISYYPLQPYVRTFDFFLVSFSFLFRLRLSINSLILYNHRFLSSVPLSSRDMSKFTHPLIACVSEASWILQNFQGVVQEREGEGGEIVY